jgi:diguanylate cyclase (GGDEF)-like protein/PAS domain S-box-containing protein
LAVAARDAASAVQVRLLDAILVSATESDKTRVKPRIDVVEQAVAAAYDPVHALAIRLGESIPAVIQLHNELARYLAGVLEVLQIAQADPASAWIIVNEVRRDYATLDHSLVLFKAEANALRESAADQAISAATLASSAFLATVVLAVGFSTLVTVVVGRSITRPLGRLTAAMSELAGGQLAIAVPDLERRDEIGSMAAAMQLFKNGMIEADRLNAERECARARELDRLRQLADATFEGIVIHRDGTIIDVNAAFCAMVGQPDPAVLSGGDVFSFVAPGSIGKVRQWHEEQVFGATELELLRANGATVPVEILSRLIDYDGDEATLIAVRDLSERKHAEARIRELAFQDPLTGLPNRALFGDRLTQVLAMARRDGSRVALLYLDLDHFKEVNDTLGHAAGDELLRVVARRLRGCLRESDTLARLGGDEFAVIQPGARQPQDAEALARRLVGSLETTVELGGYAAWVGVSVGIALSEPADADAGQRMMMDADVALYQAKDAGRGGYSFFSPDMNARIIERRATEVDLRVALAEDRLFVQYQPQVDLLSGKIVGAEALVRWNSMAGGWCRRTSSSPSPRIPA